MPSGETLQITLYRVSAVRLRSPAVTSSFASTALAAALLVLAVATPALAQTDLSVALYPPTFVPGDCGSCGEVRIQAGADALMTLQVFNSGGPAANVVATAIFPPKTSILSVLNIQGGGVCTTSMTGAQPTVTCSGNLPRVPGTMAFGITLHLDPDYPWQQGLPATISATSSTPDTNPANNTESLTFPVQQPSSAPALGSWSVTFLMILLATAGVMAVSRGPA